MGCLTYLIIFALIMALIEILVASLPVLVPILIGLVALYLIYKAHPIEAYRKYKFRKFEAKYYISEEFLELKQSVCAYIENCNDLNQHILELKDVHIGFDKTDYGKADYYDSSNYKYSRPEYEKHSYMDNIYNCSRTVCDNARMQPFKYVCKYFDIKPTEENLSRFEMFLNNHEAVIRGIKLLNAEKDNILNSIDDKIPQIIKEYGYDRFQYELGFKTMVLNEVEFPKYKFQYVSPGGNASTHCEIVMDIENLNKFIYYLAEKIKFSRSVAGQRALMTSSLRKKILVRDNFTCQKCGNSSINEPNLLLEIDHKIPLSKGGMTTEDNLQVLCWRCNRRKGSKIEK